MNELEPLPPSRPGVLAGLGRAVAAAGALLAALLLPDRGVPPLVAAGRFRLALLIVVAAGGLAAWAAAERIDLGPDVRAENAGHRPPAAQTRAPGASAEPDLAEVKTDRQIDDEIAKRTAVARVKLGLGAALGTPLKVVAVALYLLVLGAYVGGKPTMPRALAAASIGALPWAVRSLVAAAAAWHHGRLTPAQLDSLVVARLPVDATHPFVARLVERVDLFALWSLLLWGLGLAAAAGLGRLRALVTVTVGFTLYLLITTAGA